MAIRLKVIGNEAVRLKVGGNEETVLHVGQGVPIYPSPYSDVYEVTPTESEQTLSTNGLMMTDDVTVHAIDSEYVGSDVPRKSSADLTSSGATVSVPSGYYEEGASKDIPTGTVVPPVAISSETSTLTAENDVITLYKKVNVAPYVSTPGYISEGTRGDIDVTLKHSVPTRSSADLTANGNTVTAPSGYYGSDASASVQSGSATTPTGGITANPTISVSSSGLITASVSKSESITPIINEGYVTSGTAGTITFSGSNTSQLTTQGATTITPTTSEQTAVPANTYTTGSVKVSAMPNGTKGNQVNTWGWTSTTKKLTVSFPDATSGYYSANTVKTVNPIELTRQTETVSPTESSQEVTPTNSLYYLEKVTVNAIPSDYVGSGVTQRSSSDLTASGATVTAPAGYYENDATKTISSGSATPAASISGSSASKVIGNGTITLSKTIANTPQVTAGYVASGTQGNTSVELSASITTKGATTYHPSTSNQTIATTTYLTGTQTINAVTHNLLAENIKSGVTLKIGDASDDDCVASVLGTYSGGTPSLQAKTNIDPTTSSQTITADTGYDGLSSVQINAMPSGTEGTPTATKGTVTNHSVTVTPSVTNTAGYISGGTHSGTAVSVSASELVSGTYTVSSSGTKDVTNYASISVASGSATPASSISGTSATVSTGTNTLTLSKTVSNTPQVSAGYVSSGTAGNSSVSLTANVTTKAAATIYPSASDQSIASGTYLTGAQTIKGVTYSNLTADNIKNGVTVTIGDSADADRIASVTGTYSGGGGTLTVKTATITKTATGQTVSFSSLSGEPKYWFLRITSQLSSSGSTTYYYITDLFYDGTNIKGNSFRIGSTRRIYNITSGISQSYSGGTLTITGGSSTGASPGQFYGASNFGYELVYIY